MNGNSKNKLGLAGLAGALTLIAFGCTARKSPRQFILSDLKPVSQQAERPLKRDIYIEEFTIASEYSRLPFVYRMSPYQLRYDTVRKWAVPPEDMVRERVHAYFKKSGMFTNVTMRYGIQLPSLFLKGHVLKIGEKLEEEKRFAELAFELELVDPNSGKTLWKSTKSREKEVGIIFFEPVIKALSECLREILDECAAELQKELSP